ncbi:hypothetical protein [Thalassospira marina]|uniref:Uncharacterized protein n=1 Tax=Thalassospira marina TaxID=2048283 RepID=A0A2N3KYA4_9PROT|nr:hypothetical protein [Thalassospira marina]PKR55503.1 hypothetical protein COO20_04860 [Thalassospira marina]
MTGRATRLEAVRDVLPPQTCLTIDELDAALDLPRKEIVKSTQRLMSRGLLERVERGCYQLTAAGIESRAVGEALTSGPTGPDTTKSRKKKANLRTRLWRVMCVKQKFIIDELVAIAAKGPEKDARENARKYLRALELAGYLRVLPRQKGEAATSNGFKRFQLIRQTGPRAPEVKRGGQHVFDPNTGAFHDCKK